MITIRNQEKVQDRLDMTMLELRGLSTDEKPINKYKTLNIANGSIFIEMDTEEIFFYDEQTSVWVGGDA